MLAQTLHNTIGVAINVMVPVPEKTQEAADCLPKTQNITQKEKQSIVPGDVTVSDHQEKLETLRVESSEKQVSDRAPGEDVIPEISQPCINLAEAASTELTSDVEETLIDAIIDQEIAEELAEEFAFPSPELSFTLEIHASPRSDQGAQGTCSLPSSSVNPPNNSYTSLLNSPLFSDPFEYELEKLRREEVNLRKKFEETTSELTAELERKMAEAKSEYDMKAKEIEVEYKAKTMEEEANKRLVAASSLLASAFVFKGSDKSINLPEASQHSIQQQQVVETNTTHMNSTAPPPPRPSYTVVGTPVLDTSSPLFPRFNMTQPRPVSQQVVAKSNTVMSSIAPSVTSEEALPLHSPRFNTPQTRPPPPSSSSAASAAPVHSTVTPQTRPPPLIPNITPSSSSAAPVHGTVGTPQPPIPNITPSSSSVASSPLGDGTERMSQTRPRPLIPNITPSSAPSPPVHGTVRRPAPHLQRFRPSQSPNNAATSTIYVRRLVEEHKQQQGNSNGDVVCLSDDDD